MADNDDKEDVLLRHSVVCKSEPGQVSRSLPMAIKLTGLWLCHVNLRLSISYIHFVPSQHCRGHARDAILLYTTENAGAWHTGTGMCCVIFIINI